MKTYDSISRTDASDLLNAYRKPIMGVAALWILIFHEWQAVFSRFPALAALEEVFVRIGFCGVDIFFMLSGYGLVYAIQREKLGTFYRRRLKRTYPPFLIAALFAAVANQWSLRQFFLNVLGISFYTTTIYLFLWFVPAILTLYALFPWYYRLFSRHKNKVRFYGAVLLLWYALTIGLGPFRADLYGFTNRIPIFLCGVLWGELSVQKKKLPMTPWRWAAAGLIFCAGIYTSLLTNYRDLYLLVPSSNCCVPNFLIAISLPLLLAKALELLSNAPGWNRLGAVITKVLGFYGGISLELYCVQEELGIALIPGLRRGLASSVLANLAFFIIATLAAVVLQQGIRLLEKAAARLFQKPKSQHTP